MSIAATTVPPQLIEAIKCASPTENNNIQLRQEALTFLEQVKNNASETWKYCLGLFLTNTVGTEARIWVLSVVDVLISNHFHTLTNDDIFAIQEALFEYVSREYVQGGPEADLSFLRNRLAHTLTLFTIQAYDKTHPNIIIDFLSLIKQGNSLNQRTTPLVLHILDEINLELSDSIMRAARDWSSERHIRDGHIRDAIRSKDAPTIIENLLNIIRELTVMYANGGSDLWSLKAIEESLALSINVFAGWSHWVDISLSFTPQSLELFYQSLQHPSTQVKVATNGYFCKILQKGIQDVTAKLEVIRIVNVSEVIGQIEQASRDDTSDDNILFRESCAKLVNVTGLEILKLCDEPTQAMIMQNRSGANLGTPETRSQALVYLSQLQPVFLRYLADPSNSPSLAVHSFLSTLISFYKKKKKSDAMAFSSMPIREFFSQLLPIVMTKMQWNDEVEWGFGGLGEDADDERHELYEIRRVLRSTFDSVCQLDQELWISTVVSLINQTLTQCTATGPESVPWYQAELVLYIVFLFAEATQSGNSVQAFVQITEEERQSAKKDAVNFKIKYEEKPYTPLGQLVQTVIDSGIANHPHPAVNLQYFEMIVRYVDILYARKVLVEPILSAFVGQRGIHNSALNVKARNFYLFQRFTLLARKYIPMNLIPKVLESITDLLAISVEVIPAEQPDEDVLTKSVNTMGLFQYQLNLYEAIGSIVAKLSEVPSDQIAYLNQLIQPLLASIQQSLQQSNQIESVLNVHHTILAIGHIAKGLPEPTSVQHVTSIDQPPPNYSEPFVQSTQAMFVVLDQMSQFKVIRDASRFTFAQIVSSTGVAILNHVPTFVNGLLGRLEMNELSDFLVFLNMLVHKLRSTIFSILNSIIQPILDRVFTFLSIQVDGTDDELNKAEMERSYLNFIGTILSAGLQGVLISDENRDRFMQILESICQFAQGSSPPTQRIAFNDISKVVFCYGTLEQVQNDLKVQSTQNIIQINPTPIPLAGFEEFIYQQFIKLAFEVPAKSTFNLKDGQTNVVLGEIALLLRQTYLSRGEELLNFLRTVYLPSIGCPDNISFELTKHISTDEPKIFKKAFTEFIKASKSA
ncbi:hypothetical protein E3Q10_02161 [Wallemia mellicola]|uniref:Exportin-T n=1 Tax=Wallemia mellicola TaxID=1708541 RepID=A0A4T0QYT2_9BASI|nr:hypothetical protein E3Q10_02161 [Wallemia mellicola]